MKKFFRILFISLFTIILLAGLALTVFVYKVKYGLPFYDKNPPELPAEMQDFSVLVFSKTNGFPHSEAIEASIPAFEKMGAAKGWTVFSTKNAAVFNAAQLAKFDVVVWNNATGKNLTDEQRAVFRAYLENGGGFVGIHGAGDDSHHWDWYYEALIGARFSHHPIEKQIQSGQLRLECDTTKVFPCVELPNTVNTADEWYVFFDNPRDNGFEVLYTLNEDGLDMNGNIKYLVSDKDFGMGDDHPIAWYRCLPSGGRTFYSAMGHMGRSFEEPFHLQVLEKAILWAGQKEGRCD
ncbi:MAG: ThuA domain-containing protein [Bacteroidota bacterium]